MIQRVQLLDLRNLQVLAEVSYVREETEKVNLDDVLGRFYEVFEEHAPDAPFITTLESIMAYVSPLNESTIMICVSNKEPKDEEDIHRVRQLGSELAMYCEQDGQFEPQRILPKLADRFLLNDITLLFFSNRSPSFQNKTGTALAKLADLQESEESSFAGPFKIGPYRVRCRTLNYDNSANELTQGELRAVDVASIIFSKSDNTREAVARLSENLHSTLSVPILIVPGSNKELQTCRGFEEEFDLMLCDSVSEDPLALLLSVMAIAGFSDMHPELIMKRWRIEPLEPEEETADSDVRTAETEGHQEFLVIDKEVAETLYAYLYEDSAEHQRAPNVIAALSTFRLDKDSAETFVIRTGELGYAIVEEEGLLFTLITGLQKNLEDIRTRFSKLPELYLENPPPPLQNPGDLYGHPPFTLKLLATIPPYSWPTREVPSKSKEPDWERFRHPMMKDFLQTVWNSIDRESDLDAITLGSQSKMTLGALYFLRRMGAIDTNLRISPDDIPNLVREPDDGFIKQYSELQEILDLIDGECSLANIAETTNIEISIVMHVFKQMHIRGYVDFGK